MVPRLNGQRRVTMCNMLGVHPVEFIITSLPPKDARLNSVDLKHCVDNECLSGSSIRKVDKRSISEVYSQSNFLSSRFRLLSA